MLFRSAIPVVPGSSRKVEQKTTGASSGVFGASSGVLVNPNQETFTFCPPVSRYFIYFSAGRNFWMRAPIEAILVAPGSSRKVEQKTIGASSGVFGASLGVLVTPNQETFTFRPRVS